MPTLKLYNLKVKEALIKGIFPCFVILSEAKNPSLFGWFWILRRFAPQNDKNKSAYPYSALEHFHFENALLTRKRQPPQGGVDSGENDVFPLNANFEIVQFQS